MAAERNRERWSGGEAREMRGPRERDGRGELKKEEG